MKIVSLKENIVWLEKYVALRNQYAKALFSSEMKSDETKDWLKNRDVEVLIAIENDMLLGVGILYLNKKGEITLFVKKPNQGIAKLLLEKLQDYAHQKNLLELWAWVHDENEASQKFFIKNGFIDFSKENKTVNTTTYSGIIYKYRLD
ncbi:MAG: GNAT family N-acetyltransferase [Epsilonproteobacteria bacterium]|nr:GNAT family N-acetyltransferase [Campylobacterota bacterium]